MAAFSPDPITKKRYNMQSAYMKKRFGKKTVKISLNGGFSCPNIDGINVYPKKNIYDILKFLKKVKQIKQKNRLLDIGHLIKFP